MKHKGDKHFKPIKRFKNKIIICDNGCWEWIGAKDGKGYGTFWTGIRQDLAHRFSYENFVGSIPKGYELDHLCRNHACVNPDHLEVVTPSENKKRADLAGITMAAIQRAKTHCPKGHPYDLVNTYYYRQTNGGTGRMCRICMAERSKRKQPELVSV